MIPSDTRRPWWRRLFGKASAPERLGHWSDRKLRQYTALAADVDGEFAEIGVAFGRTFKRLAPIALAQGKQAHAFDSFEGMDAPGENDRREGGHPKGQFNVGGVDAFRGLMVAAGVPAAAYHLWAGFIPDCFKAYSGPRRFSFAIVDVDHYAPTRDALAWIWPLMPVGAVVMGDDYVPRWAQESSLAIDEFLAAHRDHEILEISNNQITLRKTHGRTSNIHQGTSNKIDHSLLNVGY